MTKLAQKTISVSFEEVIPLSPKADKRLEKIESDFPKGKNVYLARTTKELKKQLSG